MHRITGVLISVVCTIAMATLALAGNPHFVGNVNIARMDNTLVVSGKVAGLGNEPQIFVEIMALAQCVNPGGNQPQADNKDEVSVSGVFPVQNGKALFGLSLDGAAQIDPSCSPPMAVEYTDIVVNVFLTDGDGNPVDEPVLTFAHPGTF